MSLFACFVLFFFFLLSVSCGSRKASTHFQEQQTPANLAQNRVLWKTYSPQAQRNGARVIHLHQPEFLLSFLRSTP